MIHLVKLVIIFFVLCGVSIANDVKVFDFNYLDDGTLSAALKSRHSI